MLEKNVSNAGSLAIDGHLFFGYVQLASVQQNFGAELLPLLLERTRMLVKLMTQVLPKTPWLLLYMAGKGL